MDVFGEHLLAAAGLAVQNDGAVHRSYMIGILQQFHHGITLRDDHGWSFVSALHEANDVADVVVAGIEKTAPVIRDQHAAEIVLRQDLQQLIFLLSCGG